MAVEESKVAPQEGFAQAGPIRLHYLSWGSGARTVVCLHGTGGSAYHWTWLARALMPLGFRVVAFDQRGHGDSDKPATGYEVEDFVGDLEGATRDLGLSRFNLLGASLGSRVALMYASRHPEQIEKLILVDLSFEMPESEQQRMIEGHLNRPDSFASLEDAIEWSRQGASRKRWIPEIHEIIGATDVKQRADGRWTWRYSRDAAVQGLRAARRDMWPWADALKVPSLVVRGGESPVLTPASAEKMRQRIPNCRVVEVPDAGHGVPRDNTEGFNRVVAQFLSE